MSFLVHLLAWRGEPPASGSCVFQHLPPQCLPEARGRLILAGPEALRLVATAAARQWLAPGGRRLLLTCGHCDAATLQDWLELGGVRVVPPEQLPGAIEQAARELELGLLRWRLEPAEFLPRGLLPAWLLNEADEREAVGEPSTEHRAPSTEHRAPSTEHRAPSTEHRAPSTEHRAPSTEHRAPSTEQAAGGAGGAHAPPRARERAGPSGNSPRLTPSTTSRPGRRTAASPRSSSARPCGSSCASRPRRSTSASWRPSGSDPPARQGRGRGFTRLSATPTLRAWRTR